MKKTFLSFSLLALLAGCANDDIVQSSGDCISNITITADDVHWAEPESLTRTDLTLASGSLQFAWAESDVVGIYPNVGDQVSFPMTKGAGTKSANFDGGGWAVKASSTYAAYFPYDAGNTYFGHPYTALPFSYTGQRQSANSSTAHLGAYDYMVATASAPSNGTIGFNFTHINSFLYIQLTTPVDATFTQLTLSAEEACFAEETTVDISTAVITPTKTSTSMTLTLDNITVAAGSTLYAWMAVVPVNLLNKTITATLTTVGGTQYKVDIAGKNLETGRAYSLKGTLPSEGTGGSGEDIPLDEGDPVYTYVDLGLSVMWATFNVGAKKPEECGDYYAWGETETKKSYSWNTYKWCNGSSSSLTKYVGSKTVLELNDDVAHVKWGEDWRMPTKAEQDELRTACTWTWTQQNGVNGYKVTASNGNSIFLPAAGYREDGSLHDVGYDGRYWSSSLYASTSGVYLLNFSSGYVGWNALAHYYGFSVRPVCVKSNTVAVESVTVTPSSITLEEGAAITLTATVSPSTATDKTITWSSSNKAVATVDQNGKVTAAKAGTTVITASASNGTQASCMLTVTAKVPSTNVHNGHEYVDLGLSSGLLWASCNVGAENPEDYGNYYAWGETEVKDTYSWGTYKWCKGSYSTMTKYCTESNYGTVDNKTTLDPEDDVAQVQWGGGWRMPTKAEQDELRTECTWTWTQQNGVNCRKVTGRNGNYILLPAAGYHFNSNLNYGGSYGYYWSSSLYTDDMIYSYGVYFNYGYLDSSNYSRYYGQSVRPVLSGTSTVAVESVTLSQSEVTLEEGATVTLTATVSPSTATDKTINWSSSNKDIATVDQNGKVTAVKAGTAIITATANNGKKASCTLTVTANNSSLINGHEYVDLGLPSGLKWATCNVGAEKPEDYGDYFAWGETETKETYSWSTYKWCKGSDHSFTKYCTESTNGTVDNKTVLDPEDDVAQVKWGGGWRMPTMADLDELMTNCKWKWTTQNGVKGFAVTGNNGNVIFFPAAGFRWNSKLDYAGSEGYYWTSTLRQGLCYAYKLTFYYGSDSAYRDRAYAYRRNGISVRAVCP